jgi:uncharacterized protein (TIGR02246 family)
MRFGLGRCVFLLTVALPAGCGPAATPPVGGCDASPQAVAGAPLALIAANNRRDVEAVLDGYTEDAVWLPPGEIPVRGRLRFRERYASLFGAHVLRLAAEIDESRAEGPIGFARGRILGVRIPLDGSPPQRVDDVFLAITRCEDARWRVSHLAWSHVAPAR